MQIIALTIIVENRGTQVEQRTYADELDYTEVMVSMVATTDTMDIDEPTTSFILATPLVAKDQPLPLSFSSVRAIVVHSIACAELFVYKI